MFSESHSPVIKIAFKDESVFPVISAVQFGKNYTRKIHWPHSIWQSEEFFELINYFQIWTACCSIIRVNYIVRDVC